MTKEEAIAQFWNSFYIPAYDESTVPTGAKFPYITFSVKTDSIDNVVMASASLWYKSYSWIDIDNMAKAIARKITQMYPPSIEIDGGRMYITKGSPFAQRVADSDDTIRHILLNVNFEFLTVD